MLDLIKDCHWVVSENEYNFLKKQEGVLFYHVNSERTLFMPIGGKVSVFPHRSITKNIIVTRLRYVDKDCQMGYILNIDNTEKGAS